MRTPAILSLAIVAMVGLVPVASADGSDLIPDEHCFEVNPRKVDERDCSVCLLGDIQPEGDGWGPCFKDCGNGFCDSGCMGKQERWVKDTFCTTGYLKKAQ